MSEANARSLEDLAEEAAAHIRGELLSRRWKTLGLRWPRVHDPEKRRLLVDLCNAIEQAPEMADGPGEARARQLMEIDLDSLSLETLGGLVDAWDQLLIEHGPESGIPPRLATERMWNKTPDRAPGATTWSQIFGKGVWGFRATRAWRRGRRPKDGGKAARRMLGVLYAARASRYAIERSRTLTKVRYLWWFGAVLGGLLLAAALVGAIAGGGPTAEQVLAAVLGGALGGSLSGTFKLRDDISRISELRAFRSAFWVQPIIGATAGYVLVAVLDTGLIKDITADDWASAAAIAFAAGFSEPFFLGVVGRVAAIAEKDRGRSKR